MKDPVVMEVHWNHSDGGCCLSEGCVVELWCDSRCYVRFKKWWNKIGKSHLNELTGLNVENTGETRNSTVLMRKSHSCVVGHLWHGWLCVGVSDFVQLWWTRTRSSGSLQCCPTPSAIYRPRIKPIFRTCFCIFKGLSAHMHWNQGPLVNIKFFLNDAQWRD